MNATTTTRKATRYIVRTNGVQSGEPTTNRARAIREGERYAEAADRSGDAHHITVSTERTGKIVFEHRSTVKHSRHVVPAPANTLCGFFHSYGPNSNGYGCGSNKGEPGTAVHVLTRSLPVASAGTPLCAFHSPYDVLPGDVPAPVLPGQSKGRTSTYVDCNDYAETATIKIVMDKVECGWCNVRALYAVTVDSASDWTDYVCREHAVEWFAPHFPALEQYRQCPNILTGCDHTMIMHPELGGIACAGWTGPRFDPNAPTTPATRTLVIDYDDAVGSWGVCVDETGEFLGHASTPAGARAMRRNMARTNA